MTQLLLIVILGILGTGPTEPLQNGDDQLLGIFFQKVCHRLSLGAYIHLVKLVARTEASYLALRFRVSRNWDFRLVQGARLAGGGAKVRVKGYGVFAEGP